MLRAAPLLLLLTWGTTATAADIHDEVAAGRQAYLDGDFRLALYKLTEAQRSPDVTESDLVHIHWYSGAALHALGRPRAADDAFDALVRLRPLYPPDRREAPPELRAAFTARQRAWQQAHGMTFGLMVLRGASVVIPFSGDTSALHRALLYVRAAGAPTYRSYELRIEKNEASTLVGDKAIWEAAAQKGKLEVVIEARRDDGVPFSRRGDGSHPMEVPVTPVQCAAAVAALGAPAPLTTSNQPASARIVTALDTTGGAEQPYAPVDAGLADTQAAQAKSARIRRSIADEVRGRARTALVLGAVGGGALLGALAAAAVTTGSALGGLSALFTWLYTANVLGAAGAENLQARDQWLLANQIALPVLVACALVGALALLGSVGAGILAGASLLRREILLIDNQAALAEVD